MATTYYVTWPADTLYRLTRPGFFEGWIDGKWKGVLLSEQDHDNLRSITETEAKQWGRGW